MPIRIPTPIKEACLPAGVSSRTVPLMPASGPLEPFNPVRRWLKAVRSAGVTLGNAGWFASWRGTRRLEFDVLLLRLGITRPLVSSTRR
jgi:hypothetical protein